MASDGSVRAVRIVRVLNDAITAAGIEKKITGHTPASLLAHLDKTQHGTGGATGSARIRNTGLRVRSGASRTHATLHVSSAGVRPEAATAKECSPFHIPLPGRLARTGLLSPRPEAAASPTAARTTVDCARHPNPQATGEGPETHRAPPRSAAGRPPDPPAATAPILASLQEATACSIALNSGVAVQGRSPTELPAGKRRCRLPCSAVVHGNRPPLHLPGPNCPSRAAIPHSGGSSGSPASSRHL